MDSLDVNKAVAALLVAGIAFFITGLLGDNLIYEQPPAKPAFAIQGAPAAGAAAAPAAPAGPAPIVPLLASADIAKGQAYVQQVCSVCHSFNQGGKPIIGPNLYGIVGDPHDHEAGFGYSAALEKFKGQPWTYAALNKWLYDPQTYAPGTHMTFTGIKNTNQRADVIAYLRTLSQKPAALPSAEAVAAAKAEAEKAAPKAEAPAAQPAGAPASSGLPPIAPLLASADVAKGNALVHQICMVCHTINEGGHPLIGPNLYGIVGDPHDHEAGFDYSPALEKYKGQPWTYEALNHWLDDPAHYAPGTRMTFAGLKSIKQRADVIAYLRTLSSHPEPLPKAEQAAAATPPAATPPAGATASAPATAAPVGAVAPKPEAAKP